MFVSSPPCIFIYGVYSANKSSAPRKVALLRISGSLIIHKLIRPHTSLKKLNQPVTPNIPCKTITLLLIINYSSWIPSFINILFDVQIKQKIANVMSTFLVLWSLPLVNFIIAFIQLAHLNAVNRRGNRHRRLLDKYQSYISVMYKISTYVIPEKVDTSWWTRFNFPVTPQKSFYY